MWGRLDPVQEEDWSHVKRTSDAGTIGFHVRYRRLGYLISRCELRPSDNVANNLYTSCLETRNEDRLGAFLSAEVNHGR